MSEEEACASLIEALDAKRTDIVKTLLDHLAKADPGTGVGLKSVLARLCTKHGTLLHYAVRNSLNDAIRALLLAGAILLAYLAGAVWGLPTRGPLLPAPPTVTVEAVPLSIEEQARAQVSFVRSRAAASARSH